jgi:hypothetical protein
MWWAWYLMTERSDWVVTKKDKDKDKSAKKYKVPRAVSSPAAPIRVHDYQVSVTKAPEKPKIIMERNKPMPDQESGGGDKVKDALQAIVDAVYANDFATLGPNQYLRDLVVNAQKVLAEGEKE